MAFVYIILNTVVHYDAGLIAFDRHFVLVGFRFFGLLKFSTKHLVQRAWIQRLALATFGGVVYLSFR